MTNLLDRYRSFFQSEEEKEYAASIEEARSASEWMSQPYHKKFLKWLNEQSSKPLDIGESQIKLIEAAARVNTFKEIERHLSKLDEQVSNALQRFREGE